MIGLKNIFLKGNKMTKKSQSRLLRDRKLKAAVASPLTAPMKFSSKTQERKVRKMQITENAKSNCWDDLNDLAGKCRLLLQQHDATVKLVETDIINYVENKDLLNQLLQVMNGDVKLFTDGLLEVNKLHADKKGGSTDPDVVFQCISYFEQYVQLMERHDAVIMPVAYQIAEIIERAEKLKNAPYQEASTVSKVETVDFVETVK